MPEPCSCVWVPPPPSVSTSLRGARFVALTRRIEVRESAAEERASGRTPELKLSASAGFVSTELEVGSAFMTTSG